MIQTTQKTMHNQTLHKWATLSNTVTRYSLSQTLMSNALQYKASKGFRYIYYICRWCCRHNFWEICVCWEGGYWCNISPCEAHFSPLPPPLLIIIAQSLIPWIIFAFIPLLIVFFVIARLFNKTFREVRRLEALTEVLCSPTSPGDTLLGLPSIRAYKKETRFLEVRKIVPFD